MKKNIQYIPLTALTAASFMGHSFGAQTTLASDTNFRSQQSQSDLSPANSSDSVNAFSNQQANAEPIAASDLLGMNIDTSADEKIGEIDEIFVNSETGEIVALVVSTGGFLQMGENQTLISPKDLSFNSDRTRFQADLSKDQIRTAPRYNKDDLSGLDEVRPMTKTGQDWEARNQPTNRNLADSQSQTDADSNLADSQNETETTSPTSWGSTGNDSQQANDNQSKLQGMAVSDLIGKEIENSQGEDIGEISEVFLDLENKEVAGVVVSTGAFLGMGGSQTLFGLSELSFNSMNEAAVVNYDSEQISAFPEYKANDPVAFDNLDQRTNRSSSNRNRSLNDNVVWNDASQDGSLADSEDSNYEVGRDDSLQAEQSTDATVFDQGNSYVDRNMTASIRTAIRKDDSLSSSAKNVTIITNEEAVMLRGEVDSTSEKSSIERIARKQSGNKGVTSELTVRRTSRVSL